MHENGRRLLCSKVGSNDSMTVDEIRTRCRADSLILMAAQNERFMVCVCLAGRVRKWMRFASRLLVESKHLMITVVWNVERRGQQYSCSGYVCRLAFGLKQSEGSQQNSEAFIYKTPISFFILPDAILVYQGSVSLLHSIA